MAPDVRSFLLSALALLAFTGQIVAIDAPESLASAAKGFGAKIPAGEIVTGELSDSPPQYSVVGHAEPEGVPPEKVIFEIGSISKVFTSLLLAQAVTEGRVKLDTTVAAILGRGQKFADPRVGAITLKALATHTSGLPRLPANLQAGAAPEDPYAQYDRAHLLEAVASATLEGNAPFPWSYSNFGAGLLGDLLANAYGKPWEELVIEKIATPLGMDDTRVALSADQQKRFAPPYAGGKPAHTWELNALSGAGALRSTAADLLKFAGALLEPAKSPFPAAIAMLLEPQVPAGNIGLGIMISKSDGKVLYEHDGGTGGYRSLLQVMPANHAVRVVLTNNSALEPTRIVAALRHEKARTAESSRILSAEELALYEGVYELGVGASLTFLARDGALWARLTGQPFYQVFPHEEADRFFYKIVPAELQFRRDAGKVVSVTLLQNGREMPGRKTAQSPPSIRFASAAELEAYIGTYQLAPNTDFVFSVQSDTLFAKLADQPAMPVFLLKPDHFVYDVVPAEIEFERDSKGKVLAVNLHQNGAIQRALKTK